MKTPSPLNYEYSIENAIKSRELSDNGFFSERDILTLSPDDLQSNPELHASRQMLGGEFFVVAVFKRYFTETCS